MEAEQLWAVVVHDDEVNSHTAVAFAVTRIFGLPPERGFDFAKDAEDDGTACLTWCTTREQAEELVAALQLYGLHATVGTR